MSGAGGFGTGFPADAPFVDDSGFVTPVWRNFLVALYKRTGAEGGANPANAASQAALGAEVVARQAGDVALSNGIEAETAARIAADEQEAATRAAMDDFLLSTSNAAAGLATEQAARIAADDAEQAARIAGDNTEQAARIAGDNALQASKLAKTGDAMTGGTINGVPIGGTTPAAGHFTTLAASGLISPTSTVGIAGTVTNDNAPAGSVGEFVSASVVSGSAVPLTTAVIANVTSITLSAGDWDVSGAVGFAPAATTSMSMMGGGVSTTSAALPNIATGALFRLFLSAFVPGAVSPVSPVTTSRLSLATTTTVYLVALATFTVAACGAFGFIGARRAR